MNRYAADACCFKLLGHVCTCRAHWLDLELAFNGWRKVAAVTRPGRQAQQQEAALLQRRNTGAAACVVVCEDDVDDDAVSTGVSTVAHVQPVAASIGASDKGQAHDQAARDAEPAATANATSSQQLDQTQQQLQLDLGQHNLQQDSQQDPQLQQQHAGDAEVQQQQQPLVHVSIADYPVGMPWRPLEARAGAMAVRGLQRLSGARLAKAVRDLRELEGPYIAKDQQRWVCGAVALFSARHFAVVVRWV